MEERIKKSGAYLDLPLSMVGQSYARLRFIDPRADAAVLQSLSKYGQLSAVVVARQQGDRYELIDGFKRFRALKQLGCESVTVRVLDVDIRALKAAMISLNWKKGSICDLEEAMVVHSLYHDDALSQVQIATLLGRHKSWVCRRFSLIERLCDEALEHMRLGLINTTIGRELARLPRGNQQRALSTILKYRLCSRETARLVSTLLQRPRWDWDVILSFPEHILSERSPGPPRSIPLSAMAAQLHRKLLHVEQRLLSLSNQYAREVLCEFTAQDLERICLTLQGIHTAFDVFKNRIDEVNQRHMQID